MGRMWWRKRRVKYQPNASSGDVTLWNLAICPIMHVRLRQTKQCKRRKQRNRHTNRTSNGFVRASGDIHRVSTHRELDVGQVKIRWLLREADATSPARIRNAWDCPLLHAVEQESGAEGEGAGGALLLLGTFQRKRQPTTRLLHRRVRNRQQPEDAVEGEVGRCWRYQIHSRHHWLVRILRLSRPPHRRRERRRVRNRPQPREGGEVGEQG